MCQLHFRRQTIPLLRREVRTLKATDKLDIQMAPGGGWTARLTPKK